MDKVDVWPLFGENEALLSPHSSFNLQPIARKKGLISMHRSALVSSFVNILVFFNKLANNV